MHVLFLLFFLVAKVVADSSSAAVHFDHQAHAKPGEPQILYENPPGSGFAYATLDGSLSHSHYFNQGPPVETGRIISYEWINQQNSWAYGREAVVTRRFPVGATRVLLRVSDQTGDSSEAQTAITVISSSRELQGVFVYFYNQWTTSQFANSFPRPFSSQWLPTAAIWSHMDLPKEMRSQVPGTIRIVTEFYARRTGSYQFMVQYRGGRLQSFVNNKLEGNGVTTDSKQVKQVWFSKKTIAGQKLRIELLLSRRFIPVQLVFYNYAMADKTQPASSLGVTNMLRLSFKPRGIVPIALYGSISKANIDGGIPYELRASGLDAAGNIQVVFRSRNKKEHRFMRINRIDASQGIIYGVVPKFPRPCYATVQVITKLKGNSNEIHFDYISTIANLPKRDGREDNNASVQNIDFASDVLRSPNWKEFKLDAVSSIALGPDGRFYMGTLNGKIQVVRTDRTSVRVISHCTSTRVAEKGSILGMAFNPREEYTRQSVRLYISVSVLYHTQKETGYRWDNGEIVAWKSVPDKRCMMFDRRVISGLPVSDRDHGVNALTFDRDGNLYISVGSNTNAGVKAPGFGDLPETKLTAAILIAPLWKKGFNGAIKYNQYENPGSAKVISGDVVPYATGIRNSFGMTFHSTKGLFATDNGHNAGFGPTSTSCTSAIETKKTQMDRLSHVRKGGWYGHANRARGECKTSTTITEDIITEMMPSTTGITEYSANRFNGQMLDDLLLSKFAVHGDGLTTRVNMKSKSISTTPIADASGVAITVGPRGEIIMPVVQQGKIRVLVPKDKLTGASIWRIIPRMGLTKGGNIVRIYGYKLSDSRIIIRIGGNICTNIRVEEDWIECEAPKGKRGIVSVMAEIMKGDTKLETKTSGKEYEYI